MFFPSLKTRIDASSPSRQSSIIIFSPAAPKIFLTSMLSMANSPSSMLCATTTPLPAARPSAFITTGVPFSFKYFFALGASLKTLKSAVGKPNLFMASFAKILLPSSIASSLDGPNTLSPTSLNLSTMPFTSGTSGPTTVSPILFSFANFKRPSMSSAFISTKSAILPIPPLPGAQNTLFTLLLCVIFHANVCSRPPEPTTKTLIL